MSHPDKQQSHGRCLRPLRLLEDQGRYLASPLADEDPRSFAPFPLPGIPASLVAWLKLGAEVVWAQRRRCIAGLFLVHTTDHRWTLRLPRQHCGQDSVRWSTLGGDFPRLAPAWRIGGTFQSTSLSQGERAEDAVPAAAGIHLVLVTGKPPRPLGTFMRIGEHLYTAPADFMTTNDWYDALQEASDRLTLA